MGLLRKVLAAGVAVAVSLAATLVAGVATSSPASAASGWTLVASWNGGRTYACASDNGDGTSAVKVFWNGRNYPVTDYDGYTNSGAAGLIPINGAFKQASSGWQYSFARKGQVGPVATMNRPTGGWAMTFAGSGVGPTVVVALPVRSLSTCASGKVAVARPGTVRQSADRKACVSGREFKRLKKKMTVAQVTKVVHVKGKRVARADFSQVRRYARCGGGDVVLNFKRATEKKALRVSSRYRRG